MRLSASASRSCPSGATIVTRAWLTASPSEAQIQMVGEWACPPDLADRFDPALHQRANEQRDLKGVDHPACARMHARAEMQIGLRRTIGMQLAWIGKHRSIQHSRLGIGDDIIA